MEVDRCSAARQISEEINHNIVACERSAAEDIIRCSCCDGDTVLLTGLGAWDCSLYNSGS